jgi:tRNA-dihydrouridine synthase B
MAGCTDLAFRLLSRQYGMEFAFLEMVAADSLVRQNKKTLSLLKTAPEDKPLGAQLVGCNPDTMAEAAVIIEDMGFDLLDLNLGCPVPKIVSPGGGSALLIQPDKAGLIFKKITKSVKRIPVTVKMRKGFEDQSGKEALHISRLAEDSGMTAVTVHGRTRAQGYTGKADWEAIGMIKRNLKIPVFGNGDVLSGEDAKRLMEVSGCDGVMIGRGGLGNPWVYNEIDAAINGVKSRLDDITLEDKRQALLKHLELEIKTEGEKLALLKMRRIACWYFKNLPGASEFRNQINRTETTDQVREFILNFNPTSSSAGTDH